MLVQVLHISFCFLVSFMALGQKEGARLAQTYCGSCHKVPQPSELPKAIWSKRVFPQMAAIMGFKEAQDSLRIFENKTPEEVNVLEKMGYYLQSPMLSEGDFSKISDYYLQRAPDRLTKQESKEIPEELQGFVSKKIFIEGIKSPQTSLVHINEERSEVLLADAGAQSIYVKTSQDELFTLPKTTGPVVSFAIKKTGVYSFLDIGSIAPNDLSEGKLYQMDLGQNSWTQQISKLKRPVYHQWESLENTGSKDLIICNYGHHGGGVQIFLQGAVNKLPILLGTAGARKTEIIDLNNDGKKDVIALFCQGRERISVFYNKGDGRFSKEKVLLSFSPLMGTSYFEIHDFNQDKKVDLLVSNGDNWDYTTTPKPYHGYRIYLNDGNENFEQSWFYPQYGAAKIMALDYDQDGDLDLASIAFYDDLQEASQQFILFENKGNLKFKPWSVTAAGEAKWLSMDVGDHDNDGDEDIVLGAYLHNTAEYSKLLLRGILEIPSALSIDNKKVP